MSEYTRIITEENDTTAEINTARINGTNYKFNYEGLKNRPAWVKKTPSTMMLEETEAEFFNANEPSMM